MHRQAVQLINRTVNQPILRTQEDEANSYSQGGNPIHQATYVHERTPSARIAWKSHYIGSIHRHQHDKQNEGCTHHIVDLGSRLDDDRKR